MFRKKSRIRLPTPIYVVPTLPDNTHYERLSTAEISAILCEPNEPANEQPPPYHSRVVEQFSCSICFGTCTTRVALNPCGHANFCAECIEQWRRNNNACPFCKAPIQSVLRLFIADETHGTLEK